ncbi:MAG: hypothetical protein A2Y17_07395 [Clostridiales bacterium GWF2_38_85]|nr:MAG: hypothetical protein A2Y17_07395 [Clostridiales bacterium GWF2_38_85]HBL84303.1 hypothetical protein [Clostridiales bacterium]
MQFTILTNTYNPHMKPLADALYERLGSEFHFIQKYHLDSERITLGWIEEKSPEYLLNLSDVSQEKECRELIINSDVVYFGANPDMFVDIYDRIKTGKETYMHSERLFKHGILQFFVPNFTKKYIKQRILPSYNDGVCILSASSFLYYDYKRIMANTERIYRFGYFPVLKKYNIDDLLIQKKSELIRILCVGRFLKLKHFDDVIVVISKLYHKGYDNIRLEIIGGGYEDDNLHKLAKKLGTEKVITFSGTMTPDGVRKRMESTNIFIMSSDHREGWGAVINEAMNSGCAVLVSDAVGAAAYLIQNKINGLCYHYNNTFNLYDNLKYLISNSRVCETLGINAYNTILNLWNPETAADRLLAFAKSRLSDITINFDEGPLSQAILIK